MKKTHPHYEREVALHIEQGRSREDAERLVEQDKIVPAGQSFSAAEYRKLFEAADVNASGDFDLPPMERKFVRDQE